MKCLNICSLLHVQCLCAKSLFLSLSLHSVKHTVPSYLPLPSSPIRRGRGICDLPSCIRTAGVRLMTLFGRNRKRPPVSSRLWDLIDSSLNKQHWYVSHAVFHPKQRCRRERTRNWVKERERNREEKSHHFLLELFQAPCYNRWAAHLYIRHNINIQIKTTISLSQSVWYSAQLKGRKLLSEEFLVNFVSAKLHGTQYLVA